MAIQTGRRAIVLPDVNSPSSIQQLRSYLLDLFNSIGPPSIFSVVETTDATSTVLSQVTLDDNRSYLVVAHVIARRTGGSSGTAGDSAGYVRRAVIGRVSAGSATIIGSVQDDFTVESQAAWDCTIAVNGNDMRVNITGAANNNVSWSAFVTLQSI